MVAALLSRFELPDLRFLSFVGHSAGGQFINRFSAAAKLNADSLAVRFVIANPSNFLYFNDKRPQLPRIDRFAVPSAETIERCPRYNRYYYGLDKLPSPVKRLGAAGIKQRYAARTAYYLIGANDNDANHEQLMKTCASRLQGVHRKQRALAYMNHLADEFGLRVAHHKYAVVPGVGHRSFAMLTSACGVAALFHVDTPGCSFKTIGRDSSN